MQRRARINQMVSDFAPKPLPECRILDLGAWEGDISAQCAYRGVKEAVAIEGRKISVDKGKAKYADLKNITWHVDDVRNLSVEKYGEFDIVLCLGLLYHLDAPDCFTHLEAINSVCTGVAIIDTHFAVSEKEDVQYKGQCYRGARWQEPKRANKKEEDEINVWASIKNTHSFWLTRLSLFNAIADAGFTSAYECGYPSWNDIPEDRIAIAAFKNSTAGLFGNAKGQSKIERLSEPHKTPPFHPDV